MREDHRKNLLNLLRKASGTRNLWNVFDDFCAMTAIALANQSDPLHALTPMAVWEAREKRYLEIIRGYAKAEQALFPQMIAELAAEMERSMQDGYRDVLGEVFHELELHNKWKGQFFTPQNICDLIGRISMDADGIKRTVRIYGYASVNEPACGSGALLLGLANECRGAGVNPCREVLFVGQDVDERCIHMAYIQLSLYGFPAVLRQMNTLSMEAYGEPWYTPVYVLDGWAWKAHRRRSVEAEEQELLKMIEG